MEIRDLGKPVEQLSARNYPATDVAMAIAIGSGGGVVVRAPIIVARCVSSPKIVYRAVVRRAAAARAFARTVSWAAVTPSLRSIASFCGPNWSSRHTTLQRAAPSP